MPKEKPYPLRLEPPQEQKAQEVMRKTGLTKAFVLRMAIDVGLNAVDWARLKNPPLVAETVYLGEKKKPAPAASRRPPATDATYFNDRAK